MSACRFTFVTEAPSRYEVVYEGSSRFGEVGERLNASIPDPGGWIWLRFADGRSEEFRPRSVRLVSGSRLVEVEVAYGI